MSAISNEFKWKAFSERDGNLVILTPASLTGKVAKVEVRDDRKVLASNSTIATIANGGRAHFRFDKPGTGFGLGEKWVMAYDKSGNKIGEWSVSDPSSGGKAVNPVEALPPIDVTGLVEEMAGINRKTTAENFPIARKMGDTVANDAFKNFEKFLDQILPEADGLTRAMARTAQEFIESGLPRAVMGNMQLRDAQMFAATGARGEVAVRRGLANEAARDTAGVQYGVGLAQELVGQARATSLPFAQLGAAATEGYMGLLSGLTTITPAQRIAAAFDERAYQTQVAQFNANLGMQMFQIETGMAMQQELMREQQLAAEKAKKEAQTTMWATLGGAGLGAILGGGLSGSSQGALVGAQMGAQVGGGLGQMYAGSQTGNSALTMQGLSTGLGAFGTYQGMQSQQQMLGFQQQLLAMQQTQMSPQQSSLYNTNLLNLRMGSPMPTYQSPQPPASLVQLPSPNWN